SYADEYVDTQQPGLRLAVQPSGRKTWILRHRLGGHKYTIGEYPAHSPAQARDAAPEALRLGAKGIDPPRNAKARVTAARSDTFGACFEEYMESCEAIPLRPGSIYEKRRLIANELLSRWRLKPVQSITRRDVREVLAQVVKRSPSTANCLRIHGGAMFSW